MVRKLYHIMYCLFGLAPLVLGQAHCCTAYGQNAANTGTILNEQDGYALPMVYDALTQPIPVIWISINGKAGLPFVVDTGSYIPLVLDRWAARKLGIRPTTEVLTETPIRAYRADVYRIELMGPTVAKSVLVQTKVVGVADLGVPHTVTSSLRVAGVLGVAFLTHTTARFDFAAKTLTLFLQAHGPLATANLAVVPLKRKGELYYADVTFGSNAPVDLLVDTGSFATQVPVALFGPLNPTATPVIAVWQYGGAVATSAHLVPSIKIGDLTEPSAVVCTTERSSGPDNLGLNLLTRFRVTLDFSNRQMLLERARDYADRIRLPGGMAVSLDDHQAGYVRYVEHESAAAKAGIEQGDRITQVDGHTLATLSWPVAQSLLDGFAGTNAKLILEHTKGQRIEISYRRPSIFEVRPNVGVGLQVAADADASVYITGIAPLSPASEAGLRTGDEIVQVNGLPTDSMGLPQLYEQAKWPEGTVISLTVRRKGVAKPWVVKLKVRRLN